MWQEAQAGGTVQKAAEDRAEAEGRTVYKVQDKTHIVWKRNAFRKKSWAMKDHPVFCAHVGVCLSPPQINFLPSESF